MKKLLLVATGLAGLVVVLSLALFAACVARAGRNFSFDLGEKSTREENHALEITAGELLAVELQGGDVRVETADGEAPSLKATVRAWGESREDAESALARAKLEVAKTRDGVRVTLLDATTKKERTWGRVKYTAEADLSIRVPPGVRLEISSGSGDVEARGPFATSQAHSSYGEVRLRGIEGDLEATSDSGDVEVEGVRGKSLVAKSSYGEVSVADCDSASVEARSSSGDVKLQDVRSERVRVESSYGDVVLVRVGGEIEAKLSSGDVRAEGLSGPKGEISTSYGEVRIEKATGSLKARSSSGSVSVSGFEGSLEARSSYGSIDVEGVFTALVLDTSSGEVVARALPGSRVESAWKLSSSYGDAKLWVPEGFACDLDAVTAYGEVDLEVPVEIAAGKLNREKQAVRGKVNGGGGTVEIRCQSGDVRLGLLKK